MSTIRYQYITISYNKKMPAARAGNKRRQDTASKNFFILHQLPSGEAEGAYKTKGNRIAPAPFQVCVRRRIPQLQLDYTPDTQNMQVLHKFF